MNTQSFWYLIKTTLIEKDGSSTIFGSIKRWLAWIMAAYAALIIIAGLLPGGAFHIGNIINLSWHHAGIDKAALSMILEAIGSYVLGGATIGAIATTFQNYHNVKFGGDKTPPPSGQDNAAAQG